MILSHSKRFIFVHVQKTAGESISHAILPHLDRSDMIVGTTLSGKISNLIYPKFVPLKKHSTALMLRSHFAEDVWGSYFKFSFVRHPVDRARSLHRYIGNMLRKREQRSLRNMMFALPGTQTADPLKWPSARACLETASFSEFIRHPDFSVREQWRYLCDKDGNILVDFVGKFETLEADFRRVLDRIGVGAVDLPRRNASATPDGGDPISPQDRAYLAEMFRTDIEIFGYADAPAHA